jgi:glycerophosphoryl diester phosphodiesterase
MTFLERFANTASNYFWGFTAPTTLTPDQLANVKIVAHRGVHDVAIENSRESFAIAIENKIWGIEFDIRFTKDNVPVIHHDPSCERLYSCDAIIEQTNFATLTKLIPQIPTLKEVAEQFGRKIHLLIEIKENLTPQNQQILAETLKHLQPVADYHLLTLNIDHLKNISFAPPAAFMAVDWLDMENTIRKATELKFGAVSGHFMQLNNQRLSACKAQGLTTGTGFIETKGALYREISRGIDWIFTDHPLRLKAYLA